MNEIDITCLPDDLPEFIEVDLQNLELGHSVHLADVKLPKGVDSIAAGARRQCRGRDRADTACAGRTGARSRSCRPRLPQWKAHLPPTPQRRLRARRRAGAGAKKEPEKKEGDKGAKK